MTHCTEGLTVVARGGAVSWHTALISRALLWWLEVELCHRGGAASWHTALRALITVVASLLH